MSRWHTSDFEFLPVQAFRPRGWRAGMTMEGGKGSSAPAPDPRLIEAQIKSLGVQDAAITDILDLSKRMQPLQEEQLRFGLNSARRATEEAAQDREYSLGRRAALTGVQDTIIQDARSFNEEGTANRLQGQAITDVSNAFAAQRDNDARRMARMGIDPSSAKGRSASTMMSIQEALAKGQAATGARDQARQEGYALTDRASNVLAGYPSMSMQATGAGAQFGASGIGLASQGVAGIINGMGTASQAAGQMGSNATGMWNAQANYHANMNQSNDSLGGILGGVGGVLSGAAKAGWLSDRRLKRDIEQVGIHAETGLPVYEFSYIDDPEGRRFVGVMADEVSEYRPAAVFKDERGYSLVDYDMLGMQFKEAT